MKKYLKEIIALSAILLPLSAFAQTTVGDIITTLRGLVGNVIPILIGIAMLVFIIGIIRYITAGGDEEARKSAIHLITYGIIGLFVLVAVWGIIAVVSRTFGISTEQGAPGINVPSSPSSIPIR